MSFTNMASARSINVYDTPAMARPRKDCAVPVLYSALPMIDGRRNVGNLLISRGNAVCPAAPESSTVTVTQSKEMPKSKPEAPAKPKRAPPAKAPVKPLPQMMEEDVIPSLRTTLEAQEDLSQIELSFQDNRLEGSFEKNGTPYCFWAFFPNGILTGPKGFSLSSYGSEASTVEPFLIDEKKITARHVVFWVEKRLAAQGIIPVWKK